MMAAAASSNPSLSFSSPALSVAKPSPLALLPRFAATKPLRLLSSPSFLPLPLLSARNLPPFRPLVAQTSDWAPDNEVKSEDERFEWQEEEGESEEAADGQPQETVAGLDGWEGSEGEQGEGTEEYPEPPEEAKLFVGNLPYDVDSERLAKVFEEAGVVEVAEVIYNRETDQSRGFGFVTMSTIEEADKAVEMFHRYEINGRLLTVNKAAPRGARVERTVERTFESSFRIYVGNLPWQVDDSRLEQVFSEHGKVLEARVVYDRESGRSRGFGFVRMASHSEMDDAIAALDGQNLDGRAIRVNVAEERPSRRSSF